MNGKLKTKKIENSFTHNASRTTLIDTHCHLEMDAFDPDREEVIRRARDTGIETIITIGSDLEGNRGAIELSAKYDFIYATVGIHPHDAKDFTEDVFNQIKEWAKNFGFRNSDFGIQREDSSLCTLYSSLRNPKVVAIGEIGLDYHYENSPKETQKEVFRKQLALAKEVGLPVVIHSRDAKKDTLDIIKDSGINNGLLHCFSGDMDMAEKAMAMGFYISIAGPVTFKNAKKPREIARDIPDDYILIETDAPYLTPEPFRGKRNEPSFLIHIARTVAELRGISFEDIARITTLNAKRLFQINRLPEDGKMAYKIRNNLYLNITNRCTNSCSFCVKLYTDFVKGHKLRLSHEPSEEEIKRAIGNPSEYKEVVFCGYGEPLMRFDLVKNISRWIKENKGFVRINTNGHGNLINSRNILPELHGIVDSISISLNAQDKETYNRICKPLFKNAFNEVISFIKESKKYIPNVEATIVELEGVDIEKCKRLTEELGIKLRVRKLHVTG
ncbi:MAG: YchF/TatD family DNA exonuclease [Nitrospirae bacterium]|nr:YchF/TatD family DNA exonuclease [Nitrospirota bacterium]